jgi:MFS family permease
MMMPNNNKSLLNPAGTLFRFTILFFVSLIIFGSYFAYDSIGAIETTLIQELHLSRQTIGNLYSAYSYAAILVVLFAGILIDRLGTRKASLLFSVLICIGTVVVASARNEVELFTGRFIFGAGSESLLVAQNAIIARWFKGKELAFAFGLSLTVCRLGTLFSFNTEELIAAHFGNFRYALWAAVILCVFSLGMNLVYVLLDRAAEKSRGNEQGAAADKVNLGQIFLFGPSFWYILILSVTFYSAIFPFTALSTDMFNVKWGFPKAVDAEGGFLIKVFFNFLHMFNTAPGITSIIIFASMVFAPFAGLLVDRVGRHALLMLAGALVMIPCHLLMGVTTASPIPFMIGLGVSFVLVPAALWPCVPLIVKKEHLGTGYGLITAVQNMGLAAFPFLSGRLIDSTHGYTASQIMFASLGLIGVFFAVLLHRSFKKAG